MVTRTTRITVSNVPRLTTDGVRFKAEVGGIKMNGPLQRHENGNVSFMMENTGIFPDFKKRVADVLEIPKFQISIKPEEREF